MAFRFKAGEVRFNMGRRRLIFWDAEGDLREDQSLCYLESGECIFLLEDVGDNPSQRYVRCLTPYGEGYIAFLGVVASVSWETWLDRLHPDFRG